MSYNDWTESGFSESSVIEKLNEMGDQYSNFLTELNAHNHDDLYYTKEECDIKYYKLSDERELDYDKLDGLHAEEIQSFGVLTNGIYFWGGAIENIPEKYSLCDGSNSTPNLVGRQIVGAGNAYNVGDTGGSDIVTPTGIITINTHKLTISEMPSHNHTYVNTVIDHVDKESTWAAIIDSYANYVALGTSKTDYTSYVGENQGHNHSANFSGSSYAKSGPYMALPIIKKIS